MSLEATHPGVNYWWGCHLRPALELELTIYSRFHSRPSAGGPQETSRPNVVVCCCTQQPELMLSRTLEASRAPRPDRRACCPVTALTPHKISMMIMIINHLCFRRHRLYSQCFQVTRAYWHPLGSFHEHCYSLLCAELRVFVR